MIWKRSALCANNRFGCWCDVWSSMKFENCTANRLEVGVSMPELRSSFQLPRPNINLDHLGGETVSSSFLLEH